MVSRMFRLLFEFSQYHACPCCSCRLFNASGSFTLLIFLLMNFHIFIKATISDLEWMYTMADSKCGSLTNQTVDIPIFQNFSTESHIEL